MIFFKTWSHWLTCPRRPGWLQTHGHLPYSAFPVLELEACSIISILKHKLYPLRCVCGWFLKLYSTKFKLMADHKTEEECDLWPTKEKASHKDGRVLLSMFSRERLKFHYWKCESLEPYHASKYQAKDDVGQGDVHGPLALMSPKSSSQMEALTPPIPNRLSIGKIRNLSFIKVPLRVLLEPQLEKLWWWSYSKTEKIHTHPPRRKLPSVCGQLALPT